MSAETDEEEHQEVLLGSNTTPPTTSSSTARSERKRQRERKRRSELSSAFDELASFVIRMDPEPGDVDHERAASRKNKRTKTKEGEQNHHGISQLDMVGRTHKLLKRLHNENEELKRILNTMQFHNVSTSESYSRITNCRANHDALTTHARCPSPPCIVHDR